MVVHGLAVHCRNDHSGAGVGGEVRGRGGMVSLSLSTLLETHILDFMTHHSWTSRDVTNWGFCKVRRHNLGWGGPWSPGRVVFVDVTTWSRDLGRLDEWTDFPKHRPTGRTVSDIAAFGLMILS